MGRMKDVLQRVAFLAGLLLIWTLVARYAPWPHYLFPGPGQVAKALRRLIETGEAGRGGAALHGAAAGGLPHLRRASACRWGW